VIGLMNEDKLHLSEMGLAKIAKFSNYSKNKSLLKEQIVLNMEEKLKEPVKDLPFKSILVNSPDIDPWYIVGMIQGDGSMYVDFARKHTNFALGQEVESLDILEDIQKYFNGIGHIYKINDRYYRFQVYRKADMTKFLFKFFICYPLYCDKGSYFKKIISFTLDENSTQADEDEIYSLNCNEKLKGEEKNV
jgi:hypothetical protein